MSRKRIFLIGTPLVFGILAAIWVPFSAWSSVSTELSIFFGLLGAALPQAMALTMQAQPNKTLTIPEARVFSDKLKKQQTYWFGLFVLCGFGILLLIGGKILSEPDLLGSEKSGQMITIAISKLFPEWWPSQYTLSDLNLAPLFSGLVAAQITLLGGNLIGMGTGIIALQSLRGSAIQREAQQVVQKRLDEEDATAKPFSTPVGYGDVVNPPPERRRRKTG
jgi:hypothetical protein